MTQTPNTGSPHRVVIVGGGAGGLELAAKLGRAHGRERVTLVDSRPFHIWKPSCTKPPPARWTSTRKACPT